MKEGSSDSPAGQRGVAAGLAPGSAGPAVSGEESVIRTETSSRLCFLNTGVACGVSRPGMCHCHRPHGGDPGRAVCLASATQGILPDRHEAEASQACPPRAGHLPAPPARPQAVPTARDSEQAAASPLGTCASPGSRRRPGTGWPEARSRGAAAMPSVCCGFCDSSARLPWCRGHTLAHRRALPSA